MAQEPRYQVFISSTYRDLRAARAAVQDAVLLLRHFPIGMELFPASGDEPWALIQEVIRESDYYVLVIGGRYGSLTAEGVSFTEREYDYAVSEGKRIIAFLHQQPELLPRGDTETDPAAWQRLCTFRTKVEAHHCNYWTTPEELKTKVAMSLLQETRRHPLQGWIRNDGLDRDDLLRRMTELQARHDSLQRELDQSRKQLALSNSMELTNSSLDNLIEITLTTPDENKISVVTSVSFGELFSWVGPHMTAPRKRVEIEEIISAYCRNYSPEVREHNEYLDRFTISDDSLRTIEVEMIALGLARIEMHRFPTNYFRFMGIDEQVSPRPEVLFTCWQLTESGALILKKLLTILDS